MVHVHFDTEGLAPAHVEARAPALTLVVMLQPAEEGGGLRVWDVGYAGSDAYEDDDLSRESVICAYAAGDLVVIDSYSLHQIQPFSGDKDRISATCHVAFACGRWESWF
ncbi:MAG: 2OG-Fe(II) oxygenase [Labilithrix sp.]|nr:2OG-Fe(II) oxygenase [Labilithrix sp.]